MNCVRNLLLFTAACASSGCAAITSEPFGEGMSYHLPRTILTVTVVQYTDVAAGRTWYQIGGLETDANKKVVTTEKITSHSVPDPKHRYVAKYNPSSLSDDRFCISRTPSGLLHDVEFASDDRTPQIVFNIARFLTSVVGERPTGATFDNRNGTEQPLIRAYTGKFDPFVDRDVTTYNNALKNVFGEDVEIDVKRLVGTLKRYTAPLPQGCTFGGRCEPEAWTQRCGQDNICYRTQMEVPLDLLHKKKPIDVNYASVINPYDIGAISVTRAFLVHKVSKFKFEKGVLVAAIVRKPSEVEEFSLLPLHVVNAVLSTPSGLWAAAFTDTQNKIKTAGELAKLNTEVANLQRSQESLFNGLAATTGAIADKTSYQLDCSGGNRNLGFNFITNAAITSDAQ